MRRDCGTELFCCVVQSHVPNFSAVQKPIILYMLQHTSMVLRIYNNTTRHKLYYINLSMLIRTINILMGTINILIAYSRSSAGARKYFPLATLGETHSLRTIPIHARLNVGYHALQEVHIQIRTVVLFVWRPKDMVQTSCSFTSCRLDLIQHSSHAICSGFYLLFESIILFITKILGSFRLITRNHSDYL